MNTIYILRGLCFSGRSNKARALMKASGGNGVIICAADYFRKTSGNRYEYNFKPRRFHKAHILARKKALRAIKNGVDPVIINNPNMLLWHMYPYVLMAFNHGYRVELVEMPNTWNRSPEELYRKSRGSVPLEVMKKMKDSYQEVGHIDDILNDKECIRRWNNKSERKKNNW